MHTARCTDMASLCESVRVQSSDNNADDSDGLIVDVDGGDGAVGDAHLSPIMRDTSTAAGAASTGAAAAAGAGAAGEPHPSSCSALAVDTGTTAAREVEEGPAGAARAAVTAVDTADPDRVSGRSQMVILKLSRTFSCVI